MARRTFTCYPYSKAEKLAEELLDNGYASVSIERTNNGCCLVHCF